MEVVPNKLYDATDMLTAMGEVMEEQEVEAGGEELNREIDRLLSEGKGWTSSARRECASFLNAPVPTSSPKPVRRLLPVAA